MEHTVILIPALQPGEKLSALTEALRRQGFERLIVIDDGSGPDYAKRFADAAIRGCVVVRHSENRGKGAALRSGILAARERYGTKNAYVTADADGQHLPEDIWRVAEELAEHPEALVLGVRDFSGPDVPFRSRFGNRLTSLVFRMSAGVSCPDTQTGLRGIPPCLEEFALEVEGDRYEYEMNFLSEAARKLPFRYVPITTVYEDNNSVSHFRVIRDSLRIYGRFLRYVCASLAGAATDWLLFWLFTAVLPLSRTQSIFLATALARICSGAVNFTLNRYWSFRSKAPAGGQAVRYGILFVCQMAASAGLVTLLSFLPELLAKVLVDTCLFFASYLIQKNWVFRAAPEGEKTERGA